MLFLEKIFDIDLNIDLLLYFEIYYLFFKYSKILFWDFVFFNN